MRLPQSSSQPFSFRLFSIPIHIVLAVAVPLCVQAGAQQLVSSPSHIKFGTVTVGQSVTQYIVLTNTGIGSATISTVAESDAGFSVSGFNLPYVLPAGQSVALKATFAPTGSGWTSGKATFITNASKSLQVGFMGTGASTQDLTASPATLPFGSVAVGSSSTQSIVLTNSLTRKQTLLGFQMVGSGFTISGPALPVVLSPGQTATVQITFAPQTAGPVGGSLFVAGPAVSVPFNGTGTTVGQLAVAPGALSFGNVMVGSAGTQTSVLTASGGPVTISSAASSNAQFAFLGTTFPFTINAGQSAQMNVIFTPQKSGTTSATLSFSSNASNGSATESATGAGTNPQVSLGWTASTSDVQGYNLYRGTAPGVYAKINSSLDLGTSFTDTAVASGTTYYYAATSVSSTGEESAYSSPVKVVVP
jgi:hypothetical protein